MLLTTQRPLLVARRPGIAIDDPLVSAFLKRWHKAYTITGFTEPSALTNWDDSSGTIANVTQAAAAKKPTIVTHPFLYLPGTANNNVSTPDDNSLDITGDIDIRFAIAMDDWTPAATKCILAKYNTTGNQRAYRVEVVAATGLIRFVWSTTGSDAITKDSTVAPTIADGAMLAIRITLDVDNGLAGNDLKFWTKATTPATAKADCESNAGWVQLGATVTTALATSIFPSTAVLRLGTMEADTNPFAGRFYAFVLKNGIDGSLAASVDFVQAGLVSPFVGGTGLTWTVNQSAGAPIARLVSTLNGRQVVMFDGSDDLLAGTAVGLAGTTGSVYSAVRPATFATTQITCSSRDEGTLDSYHLTPNMVRSTANIGCSQVNNDAFDSVRGDTVMVAGQWYLLETHCDGSAYELWMNGVLQTITILGGANTGDWWGDTINRDNWTVGAAKSSAESAHFCGSIAEKAVYDGVVFDAATKLGLRTRLMNELGIG